MTDEERGVRHALKLRHYVRVELAHDPHWRQVDAMECGWGDQDEITYPLIRDLVEFLGHDRVKLRMDYTYPTPRTVITWESKAA